MHESEALISETIHNYGSAPILFKSCHRRFKEPRNSHVLSISLGPCLDHAWAWGKPGSVGSRVPDMLQGDGRRRVSESHNDTRPWLSHHMTFAITARRVYKWPSLDGDKPVYIVLHIRDDHEPNITCYDTLERPYVYVPMWRR